MTDEEELGEHPESCFYARPDSPCECKCGGKYHAAGWSEQYEMELNTPLSEELGGEVAEIIKQLKGKSIECRMGHNTPTYPLFGYLHDGGIPDASGTRWWIYAKCEKCGYEWSWWKIKARLGL